MSRPYRLAGPAKRDLDDILVYVDERDGADAARRVYSGLVRSMVKVGQSPGIGTVKPEYAEEPVRFWPIWSWFLIYDSSTTPVRILRVVHSARDISSALSIETDEP